MAITIQPVGDKPELRVSGDVDVVLTIPASGPRPFMDSELVEPYYIALSNGSLVRARFCDRPDYEVIIEGAGFVSTDDKTRSLTIEWPIEWVSVSSVGNATAVAQKSERSLPLFLAHMGPGAAVL